MAPCLVHPISSGISLSASTLATPGVSLQLQKAIHPPLWKTSADSRPTMMGGETTSGENFKQDHLLAVNVTALISKGKVDRLGGMEDRVLR